MSTQSTPLYPPLCSMMESTRAWVNINWKVSDGDSGMVTLGPIGEVNGGMVTGLSVEDQHGRVSDLGLEYHMKSEGV